MASIPSPISTLSNGNKQIVPDSTTVERTVVFSVGEEVLITHTDGRFFLGTIVQICAKLDKCLLKFDDGTERWSNFNELTRLTIADNNEYDDISCIFCRSVDWTIKNRIVPCYECARTYHQDCHVPRISDEECSNIEWLCSRCVPNNEKLVNNKTNGLIEDKTNGLIEDKTNGLIENKTNELIEHPPAVNDIAEKPVKGKRNGLFSDLSHVPPKKKIKRLPYNMYDLEWDIHHTINTSQQYCYCGQPGDWFLKMIQCDRCRQWFHEKCISCLLHPLLFGDRFYIFVCSICNHGSEFVSRLEVKWVDIVHLTLFNLTACFPKRFYDFETEIVDFVDSYWNTLQLSATVYNSDVKERRDKILAVLSNNHDRFRCDKEDKKRTLWGLRKRIPPLAPRFIIPICTPLTEHAILYNSTDEDIKIVPRSVWSKYVTNEGFELKASGEGIALLRSAVKPSMLLPKGLPAEGHNVCIKSASTVYPDRGTVDRAIRKQKRGELELLKFDSKKGKQTDCKPLTVTTRHGRVSSTRSSSSSSSKLTDAISYLDLFPPTPPPADAPNTCSLNGCVPTPPPDDTSDADSEQFPASKKPGTRRNASKKKMSLSIETVLKGKKEVPKARVLPNVLSLPLKFYPVETTNPVKRKLSEKDIRVNRNGEVKRRNVRKPKKLITPVNAAAEEKPNDASSVYDMRSCILSEWGADARIARGEPHQVIGKRTLANGKVEYLVQWGPTTSDEEESSDED